MFAQLLAVFVHSGCNPSALKRGQSGTLTSGEVPDMLASSCNWLHSTMKSTELEASRSSLGGATVLPALLVEGSSYRNYAWLSSLK